MSNTTSGHTSRAKEPSIIHEAQKPVEFIGSVFTTIAVGLVVLVLIFWIHGCQTKAEEKAAAAEKYAATNPPAHTVQSSDEALVLMHEDFTPFSTSVGWSYKNRTDGDPLDIKYNGCDQWVHRPAKGDFKAPECFQPGEAQFASGDSKNPHIKVWVYKIITVQGGR